MRVSVAHDNINYVIARDLIAAACHNGRHVTTTRCGSTGLWLSIRFKLRTRGRVILTSLFTNYSKRMPHVADAIRQSDPIPSVFNSQTST
jgi:hypothetical protein